MFIDWVSWIFRQNFPNYHILLGKYFVLFFCLPQEVVVEVVPETVVHEENEWGISLVDEDLGDAGKHTRDIVALEQKI